MLSILTLVLTVSLAHAVLWPKGTYTLVKPKSGCPYGWKEGWRQQDNEDDSNSNYIPPNHQFYGTFQGNFVFHYCTKDAHSTSGSQNWPRGNYCILKQISCPPGFETGYIYWDDEDSSNANSKDGVLPSGHFDRNTLIHYCCRSDGYYMNGIDLPKSKPFYLLRYTSPCQRVKGMSVQEHEVKTDDEDNNNKNFQGGSHPKKTGGNTKLYYCYYQKY